jgi:arylsulfatase A-like enzyme
MNNSIRLFSLLVTLPSASVGSGTAERPPNIVMIAVDDLNNWISALGGPARTPNMDRLASSGTLFRNAYCVVPACNPSRVALMTGLRPETTGQYENEGNFRQKRAGNEDILTLPQRLRAIGYRTAAAGKVFHHARGVNSIANPLSDPVSWDEQYIGGTGTGGTARYVDANGWAKWLGGERGDIKNEYGLKSSLWGPIEQRKEETNDWKTARFSAEFILRTHDRPYFLACGIFRPHAPLLAPREYFDLYPLDKVHVPYLPPEDFDDIPAIARENWSTPLFRRMRDAGEWQRAVQAYLACTTFADDCVGQVLDAIELSPDRDNTIIVLVGDHGWQLGHKERWEKFSLWKQATNTAFIFSAPGMPGGASDRAVSFLDIVPTVLELVGTDTPDELEGVSLVPLLRDPLAPRDVPAVVTYMPGNHSVIHEHWNYIVYADGSEELYDHRSDPAEHENLIGRPDAKRIVERLRRYIPETPAEDRPRVRAEAD